MVKELRTRTVVTQIDFLQEWKQMDDSQKQPLNKKGMRKLLSKRQEKNKTIRKNKEIKFNRIVSSGDLSHAIDETSFECPICLSLLVMPRSLPCGHIFCQRCLEANAAHTHACCLCRQQFYAQPSMAVPIIETLINRCIVPKCDAITYLCRVTQTKEWLKRRKVGEFRVGMMVDYQDFCCIWRRAVITQIIYEEDGFVFLNLKIYAKTPQFRKYVSIKSKKLAPYLFFTKKQYLQECGPGLMDPVEIQENRFDEREIIDNDNEVVQNADNFLNLQQIEESYEQPPEQEQQSLDEALILFNHEMRANQILM